MRSYRSAQANDVTDIQLVEADVRRAARSVKSAADEAQSVELGTHVGETAGTMPSSNSASAATRLAAQWNSDVQEWSRLAGAHAELMSQAASHITAADVDVASTAAAATKAVSP